MSRHSSGGGDLQPIQTCHQLGLGGYPCRLGQPSSSDSNSRGGVRAECFGRNVWILPSCKGGYGAPKSWPYKWINDGKWAYNSAYGEIQVIFSDDDCDFQSTPKRIGSFRFYETILSFGEPGLHDCTHEVVEQLAILRGK